MKKLILLSGLFILLAAAYFKYVYTPPPFISPLSDLMLDTPPPASSPYIKYAFLPYWNVNDVSPENITPFTHLAYFGVEPNPDGSIKKRTLPTQAEPGWHTLNKESTTTLLQSARANQIHTQLVIKLLDKAAIEALLNDTAAQTNLINTILDLLAEYQFQGVNIDFEPEAPVSQTISLQFSAFIEDLNRQLKRTNPEYELSIDVYASAASKPHLWDLPTLSPHTDYFIVMAYDYHRSSSTVAGPVAPLYSDNDKNIMNHLKDISEQIPISQIVLGVPTYGYQWQTTTSNNVSPTYPRSGESIPWDEIVVFLSNPDNQIEHDPDSLSSRIVYELNQKIYQIHYDSYQTLIHKLNLIKDAQLKGIAFWALGYELNDPNFYQFLTQ